MLSRNDGKQCCMCLLAYLALIRWGQWRTTALLVRSPTVGRVHLRHHHYILYVYPCFGSSSFCPAKESDISGCPHKGVACTLACAANDWRGLTAAPCVPTVFGYFKIMITNKGIKWGVGTGKDVLSKNYGTYCFYSFCLLGLLAFC